MVLAREGPEIFQHLVLALELLDLLLGLRDLVVLVDLRKSVSRERVVSHLLVFAGPSPQRRVLYAEFLRQVFDRHLPGQGRLRRRGIGLPAVSLSSSGRPEHLSLLTWCPIRHTHST